MPLPSLDVAREERRAWEAQRITQFGVTHNVLLGLTTAAIGFLLRDDSTNRSALGLCSVSLLAGLALAWTRLLEFRLTARRYRLADGANRGTSVECAYTCLERKANSLGRASWRLLALQTITFLLAGMAVVLPSLR